MEHRKLVKTTRIIAVVLAMFAILSMETGITPLKVILMVAGLAWLWLGVYADGRA